MSLQEGLQPSPPIRIRNFTLDSELGIQALQILMCFYTTKTDFALK